MSAFRSRRSGYQPAGSAFFGQSFPPNAFELVTPPQMRQPMHTPMRAPMRQGAPAHTQPMQPRTTSRPAPVFSSAQPAPRVQDRSIRPFVEACRLFYDFLVTKIQTATQSMTTGTTLVRLNPSMTFNFQSARGPQQWQLHTLLYGKKQRMEHSFYKRDRTHEEYGIPNPFVAVQFQLYQNGLYLTNISDPDKSFSLVLKISRHPPSPSAGALRNQWHGQQRMLFDPATDTEFMRKFIEKIYLADIHSASDFLNTMFSTKRQDESVMQTICRALNPTPTASASAPVPAPADAVDDAVDAVDDADLSASDTEELDTGFDDENVAVGGLGVPE